MGKMTAIHFSIFRNSLSYKPLADYPAEIIFDRSSKWCRLTDGLHQPEMSIINAMYFFDNSGEGL